MITMKKIIPIVAFCSFALTGMAQNDLGTGLNGADKKLNTEYTSTKKALDEEVEKWETLSMQLEEMKSEK